MACAAGRGGAAHRLLSPLLLSAALPLLHAQDCAVPNVIGASTTTSTCPESVAMVNSVPTGTICAWQADPGYYCRNCSPGPCAFTCNGGAFTGDGAPSCQPVRCPIQPAPVVGASSTLCAQAAVGAVCPLTRDAPTWDCSAVTVTCTGPLAPGPVGAWTKGGGDCRACCEVVVTPFSGLVGEDGTSASFTVRLVSPPAALVMLPLASSNPAEGTVSPPRLEFTAANWNVPQTVEVSGVDDDVLDGDSTFMVIMAPTSSADPNYDRLDALDLRALNRDDDVPAISAGIPANPLLVSEDGVLSAAFTVVLDAKPLADVVVPIEVGDTGEVRVAPTSVTFTPVNWDVPRNVQVLGQDDDVADGDVDVTVYAGPSTTVDVNFAGLQVLVPVRNHDRGDAAGVALSAAAVEIPENGGVAIVSVTLTSEPTRPVILHWSSDSGADGLVAPQTQTFSSADWSVPQQLTITAVDDARAEPTSFRVRSRPAVSADSGYSAMAVPDVSVNVLDDDVAQIVINPVTRLQVDEAGQLTPYFSFQLMTEPVGPVAFTFTVSNADEGRVTPNDVTISPGTWEYPVRVAVRGVDDTVADGPQQFTVNVQVTAVDDPMYHNYAVLPIQVTNADDDTSGILVDPTTAETDESGRSAVVHVSLTSEPSAPVRLNFALSDPTEGLLGASSIVFSPGPTGNWGTAVPIVISGKDDAAADGNKVHHLEFDRPVTADPTYATISPASVRVTNFDNDGAGVEIIAPAVLETDERGTTAEFSARLTGAPTGDVELMIDMGALDTSEVTVTPLARTFNSANWHIAASFVVTGVDDAVHDGDVRHLIRFAPLVAADLPYNGMGIGAVQAVNRDDDTAGFVASTDAVTTTEGGTEASFLLRLASQPRADVTLKLCACDAPFEGLIQPTQLVFTEGANGNWNQFQAVTVKGLDDRVADGDVKYNVAYWPAVSADRSYNGALPPPLVVTNRDNDEAGIAVTAPPAPTTMEELAGSFTMGLTLRSEPRNPVQVTCSSSDPSEATVVPQQVTIHPGDYLVERTVTVVGVEDFEADGDVEYSVTCTMVSLDTAYHTAEPAVVTAVNLDDDVPVVVLDTGNRNPVAVNELPSASNALPIAVSLSTKPSAQVQLAFAVSDPEQATVTPSVVTITPGTWSTPRTVTVEAADDSKADGDVVVQVAFAAAVSHDPAYAGQRGQVDVTVLDDDVAGVVFSAVADLRTTEAGGEQFVTARLAARPAGHVVFTLDSDRPTEGFASPTRLTFDHHNWHTNQVIKVTGVDDDAMDGDVVYTIVTGPGTGDAAYNGLDIPDLTVTNLDNDQANVLLAPTTGIVVSEDGTVTAWADVALATQPAYLVEIVVRGCVSGEALEGGVLASPCKLTFDSTNWSTRQRLELTAADNQVAEGDRLVNIPLDAVTVDPNYASGAASMLPALAVTVVDDDTAGVVHEPVVPVTPPYTTTEDGGEVRFRVSLKSKPRSDVVCELAPDEAGAAEGLVTPSTVIFTPDNYNFAVDVVVKGLDDHVADGDVSYYLEYRPCASALDPAYDGLDPPDIVIRNDDNDVAAVRFSSLAVTTTESGLPVGVGVTLGSRPGSQVRIDLLSSDANEGIVTPQSLVVHPDDWNNAAANWVEITPVQDYVKDGNVEYLITTARVISVDPRYSGLDPPDIVVANIDTDMPGVRVRPGGQVLNTHEDGLPAVYFDVALTTRPKLPVALVLMSSNPNEGVPQPSMLNFEPANWNFPQTVTVTGRDDTFVDGDVAYEVQFKPARSFDPDYNQLEADPVPFRNIDNDRSAIRASPSAVITTERGGVARFEVVLESQPSADVTVPLRVSDATEVQLDVASLLFTPATWNIPQEVSVVGQDDAVADGNVVADVDLGPSASLDPAFANLWSNTVLVENLDDDLAGIIGRPQAVSLQEAGGYDEFVITLTSQPRDPVEVVTGTDSNRVDVHPQSLIFSPDNWNVGQTLTITARDDVYANSDADGAATIQMNALSADPAYSNLAVAPASRLVANVLNDDTPGIKVEPTAGLSVTENGDAATFRVKTATPITGRTTVQVSSRNLAEGQVYPSSLVFLPGNADVWQTVWITGVQDAGQQDGDQNFQVNVGPVASLDPAYATGISDTLVNAINEDDDQPGIVVSQYAGVVVSETGTTAEITVRLQTPPTASVLVNVRSGQTTEGTVDVAVLQFTTTNWFTRQRIIITGQDDGISDGDRNFPIILEPGGSGDFDYNNFPVETVGVTNIDNDVIALAITDDFNLETTEWGGQAVFRVSLQSRPLNNVRIDITSLTPLEGSIATPQLNFDNVNWASPQQVIVNGVDDANDDGDQPYIVRLSMAASPDAQYRTLANVNIDVTNIDDDPNRPQDCSTHTGSCQLLPNAANVRCPALGCDDATCCTKCNTGFPQALCPSGRYIQNYLTEPCPPAGCDRSVCCEWPVPPLGVEWCDTYTGCDLVAYPDRVWCPLGSGCTDSDCCSSCASFDAGSCASGFLRVGYEEVSCPVGGCTADHCCRPTACFGVQCAPPTQCHIEGVCNPGTGLCDLAFRPASSSCDDGLDTTTNDKCNGIGVCLGQARCAGVSCRSKSTCHADGVCDPYTGLCSEPILQNGVICDDADPSTSGTQCDNGVCVGTIQCNGFTCASSNPQCAVSQCGVSGGTGNTPEYCMEVAKPNGASCDDRKEYTFNDRCYDGFCMGEDLCVDVVCTAVDQCFAPGVCDRATGVCNTPPLPDGTVCDDADASTIDDVCMKGQCIGRGKCEGVICPPSDDCHQPGICNVLTGLCEELNEASGTACDDGEPSTVNDACDGNGACIGEVSCTGVRCVPSEPQCHLPVCQGGLCTESALPDNTRCNDNDPATFNDVCLSGRCVGRSLCQVTVCQAQHQCHLQGQCEPSTGRCSPNFEADLTPCNDDNVATKNDVCISGRCVGKPRCSGVVCVPRTPCHEPGVCDPNTGLCSEPFKQDGVMCDDTDSTTSQDVCSGGACVGSVVCGGATCTSTAPCLAAYCSVDGKCTSQKRLDGTPCDDANRLTVGDVCNNGVCMGESKCAGVLCAAASACHRPGACNPATGLCELRGSIRANGDPCDDLNAATWDDQCRGGKCVGINPCDAGPCVAPDQCHTPGTCSRATGLCTPVLRPDNEACNDGNAATTGDRCTGGVCSGAITCGGAQCRAANPACNNPLCLGNVCSETPKPDGSYCNDEDPLTMTDVCQAGTCVGTSPCDTLTCQAVSDCHEAGECNAATGICTTPMKPDGSPCDDRQAATVGDQCHAGSCVGRSRCYGVVCPAKQCFSSGVCDPASGQCSAMTKLADGTSCDDGNSATVNDECFGGTCEGTLLCGGALCSVFARACFEAVCIGNMCEERPRAAEFPCDDSNDVTVEDQCDGAGVCRGVDKCVSVNCVVIIGGAHDCIADPVCNKDTGICEMRSMPDGSPCSDNDVTTYDDECQNAVCEGTSRCAGVTCPPVDSCHVAGTCDVQTGLCRVQQLPSGTACDDNDAATTNDVCILGACTGVLPCGGNDCMASDARCNRPVCNGNVCSQTPKPDLTPCDDDNPRTFDDQCIAGVCVGTDACENVVCSSDASHSCYHPGVCDPKLERCLEEVYPDGTMCDDGNPETSGDACAAGTCVGTPKCEGVVCAATNLCHDAGVCNPTTGTCSDPLKPDGTACNDANVFSTNDMCSNGICRGTTVCNGVTCTVPDGLCQAAACGDGQRCVVLDLPDGSPCNDHNSATSPDQCLGGVCVSSGPCANVICEETQCREAGTCVPNTGQCGAPAKPDNIPCDDDDALTFGDRCWRGTCKGTPACEGVVCQSDNPCAVSAGCNPATGLCTFSPQSDNTLCNDKNPLTQNDKCIAGVCTGEITCGGAACVANDSQCMTPSCSGTTCGAGMALPDGTPCDDLDERTVDTCVAGACIGVSKCEGVVCTAIDSCHHAGTCEVVTGRCNTPVRPDGTSCNDGDPNTASSVCHAGACISNDRCMGVTCTPLSDCHAVGMCDPSTGMCTNPFRTDGTLCNDDNPDTADDACQAGVCTGVDLCFGVLCAASDQCHKVGVCDPSTGLCSDPSKYNGALCDDLNPATNGDQCVDGVCVGRIRDCGGQTCVANDNPGCMSVSCTSKVCLTSARPNGFLCNDGDPATQGDSCIDGVCVGHGLCAFRSCPESQCSLPGSCNPATGLCSKPHKPDGSLCNDGNANTVNDRCVSGTCSGDVKCNGVVCPALTQCHTQGSCMLDSGLCNNPFLPDNSPCDDDDTATDNDVCVQGACHGTLRCPGAAGGICPPPTVQSQCRNALCLADRCDVTFVADGTMCDDGNPLTFEDICIEGVCRGHDRCQDITCAQVSSCYDVGVCNPATGTCSLPPRPNGVGCDDSDSGTHNDQCQDGVCIGRNRCEGVVCGKTDQCHLVGTCDELTGFCTHPLAQDDSICDDLDPRTTQDRCVSGVCVGMIECDGAVCAAQDPLCNVPVCVDDRCGQTAVPDGTPCNDQNPNTVNDVCTIGVCSGENLCRNVVCTPMSQCHRVPTCDPRSGTCLQSPVPDGQGCDDGSADTREDKCRGGVCVGVPKCQDVQCPAMGVCYDSGVCDPYTGLCSEPIKPAGTPCDDGSVITVQDQCVQGVCVGRVMCDGVACVASDARCNSVRCVSGECQEVPYPDGSFCNDADPYTAGDQCSAGDCVGVSRCEGVICTARSPCHAPGACDPSTGVCSTVLKPNHSPCDDGNVLTTGDTCIEGVCHGKDLCFSVTCLASDTCHLPGTCQPSTGLCTDPVRPGGSQCDDMNPNTKDDSCTAGACGGTLTCSQGTCAAPNPQCQYPMCRNDGRCEVRTKPDLSPCNDNNAGTENDRCVGGVCAGTDRCLNVNCLPISQCHQAGTCNPATGLCSNPFVRDGMPCDDANELSHRDQCNQGTCAGVSKCEGVVCTPIDGCHEAGSCDPSTGLCTEPIVPNDTPCNDGDGRTFDDVCQSGVCTGSIDCDGAICYAEGQASCGRPICEQDVCRVLPRQDGTSCSDMNFLTVNDRCDAGTCVGVDLCAGVSCAALKPCFYDGECIPSTGECDYTIKPDSSPCTNPSGPPGEICIAGECVQRNRCSDVVCPMSSCTFSAVCLPTTGTCQYQYKLENTTCDDNDPRTVLDTCQSGECRGRALQQCDFFTLCEVPKPSPSTIDCLPAGCDRQTCCLPTTCASYPVTECQSSRVCPAATGCTDAICCGTCGDLRSSIAPQCASKEVKPDVVCPTGGCTAEACCQAGEPLVMKTQIEFRGPFPGGASAQWRGLTTAVLADVLLVAPEQISDLTLTNGPDGTVRVGATLTKATVDPSTGSTRDPSEYSYALQQRGMLDVGLGPNSKWLAQGGVDPLNMKVYPATHAHPLQCGADVVATSPTVTCSSPLTDPGYGCPLDVFCRPGLTPCCVDIDGSCDDGTDAVACVPYSTCRPGRFTPIKMCESSGAAATGCNAGGITCPRVDFEACCCDADGSCTDGDSTVCCADSGREVDECRAVCPTCADSGQGNICTKGSILGPQACVEGDPLVFGDWQCQCVEPRLGDAALKGLADCRPPPARETDVLVSGRNGLRATDLASRVAELTGLPLETIVVTAEGAGDGMMRVILPDEQARRDFQDKTESCVERACRTGSGGSLQAVTDLEATQCAGLAYRSYCERKGGCSFDTALLKCRGGPGAAPPDSDDGGVEWWVWLVVVLLVVILCVAFAALLRRKPKKNDPEPTLNDLTLTNEQEPLTGTKDLTYKPPETSGDISMLEKKSDLDLSDSRHDPYLPQPPPGPVPPPPLGAPAGLDTPMGPPGMPFGRGSGPSPQYHSTPHSDYGGHAGQNPFVRPAPSYFSTGGSPYREEFAPQQEPQTFELTSSEVLLRNKPKANSAQFTALGRRDYAPTRSPMRSTVQSSV